MIELNKELIAGLIGTGVGIGICLCGKILKYICC